jgi:hypothetical protein
MQERDGDSIRSDIGSVSNLIRMVLMLIDIAPLRAIAWVLRTKGWVWKRFRFSHRVLFLARELTPSFCLDRDLVISLSR